MAAKISMSKLDSKTNIFFLFIKFLSFGKFKDSGMSDRYEVKFIYKYNLV